MLELDISERAVSRWIMIWKVPRNSEPAKLWKRALVPVALGCFDRRDFAYSTRSGLINLILLIRIINIQTQTLFGESRCGAVV
jgi:hypothetical protein